MIGNKIIKCSRIIIFFFTYHYLTQEIFKDETTLIFHLKKIYFNLIVYFKNKINTGFIGYALYYHNAEKLVKH